MVNEIQNQLLKTLTKVKLIRQRWMSLQLIPPIKKLLSVVCYDSANDVRIGGRAMGR